MMELRKASIVILASSHNPTILSPGWVEENLCLNEAHTNFVHTPPFVLFESPSFRLTADADRWELVAKALYNDRLERCGGAAASYMGTLAHIPYRSIGLNFVWTYASADDNYMPTIGVRLDGSDLNDVLQGSDPVYSGRLRVHRDGYLLQVSLEKEDTSRLILNFNYSFRIDTRSAEERKHIVNSFVRYKEDSEDLARCLVREKESHE